MAGDWIKMRHDLYDDPSVVRIARLVGLDRDTVVGKLYRLWAWADRHTTDGKVCDVGPDFVDDLLSCSGFAAAMQASGWLVITGDCFSFPRFDRHNGKSAKKRAMNQKFMQSSRADSEPCGAAVVMASPPEAAPPEKSRVEKKREEEIQPAAPVATSEPPKRRPRSKPADSIRWSPSAGWEGIEEADRTAWATAYPACDIAGELARMTEWLKANPAKARKSNWRAFVTKWLTRSQDRGGGRPSARPGEAAPAKPWGDRPSWRDDACENMTEARYQAWRAARRPSQAAVGLAQAIKRP